jgi:two-component system chemotaxis sensor kinase CheA
MVPVLELLERLPLIVRAVRRSTGKAVALQLDGGGAEIDKSVADLVFPALVHLVRNAIDHGVESPAAREKAGKPAEATLRVACVSRSSTGVVISVEDDGRGIDVQAVLQRAGRASLPAAPGPAADAAVLDLICQPGLSTRDEATTTSGRGLGMDIVKRIVVDQLGGELVLRTEAGKGTTFTLQIPLTVAIIDAFVVECGGQRFVVPVATVEEVAELDPTKLIQPPQSARRPAGDEPARVVRHLGIVPQRRETVSVYEMAAASAARPPLLKALVVRRRGELVALVVDRVIGQQEAIVRPLVDPLARVPGFTGATELGDGRPTLVLDVGALTAASRVGAAALGAAGAPRRLSPGEAGQPARTP